MIKVTSGKFRGRGVDSPPRSREVRPTTALMRESIFNKFQCRLPECRFLDLFAGSGIMGLEALSRGAAFVLAIDLSTEQCRAIRKNYAAVGLTETEAKVVPYDAKSLIAMPCREEAFDLIFIDPPYGFKKLPAIVEDCIRNGWVKPDGVLIVEHGSRDPDLEGFTRKNYGDTSLSFRMMADS